LTFFNSCHPTNLFFPTPTFFHPLLHLHQHLLFLFQLLTSFLTSSYPLHLFQLLFQQPILSLQLFVLQIVFIQHIFIILHLIYQSSKLLPVLAHHLFHLLLVISIIIICQYSFIIFILFYSSSDSLYISFTFTSLST